MKLKQFMLSAMSQLAGSLKHSGQTVESIDSHPMSLHSGLSPG